MAELLLANHSPDSKALIVTGEIAFARDLRVVYGTTLVGDSSAVALVSNQGNQNYMRSVSINILGKIFKRNLVVKNES